MEAMVGIINGLLCTETEKIRTSTAALIRAYETPETLPYLVHIVNTNEETQIRHYAAVLLNKRLGKLDNWLMVPAEHKAVIKRDMLQALVTEQEKLVRNALGQFVGILVKHEADNLGSWMPELLTYVFDRCSSADPKESELGSSTYAILSAAAPDLFSVHMETICQLLAKVLLDAVARGSMTTPTVENMIIGTSYLLKYIAGNTATEQAVVEVLPLISKALHAFALKGDADQFVLVFAIFGKMARFVPHLLDNVKLVEFCLWTGSNKQIDSGIRVQVINFLGRIARIKKEAIVEQNLLVSIVSVVFNIMCDESDTEEDCFLDESSDSSVTAASDTLDVLAINMPSEKLIAALLQLLVPTLQSPDPMRRRAVFYSLGTIADGCSETIRKKYLVFMLKIVKSGIADGSPEVRDAAFFALGQFSEFLQPEISKYASLIFSVLFDNMHRLATELKRGQPEPKRVGRLFDALDKFCEELGEDIVPHLPILMERLFDMLEPQNSVKIRKLALRSVANTSGAARENLGPYFSKIFQILKSYLLKDVPDEVAPLRLLAIDTLSSISVVLGKEHSLPLATDTKNYCLMMLEEGPNDSDFRSAIYALISSLSFVVNERMAAIFPHVIPRLMQTVLSTEDVELCLPDEPEADEEKELDGYQGENDFTLDKKVAILTLKDFATNTGAAFTPYLQPAFENVYKELDHASDTIRRASALTLCEFVTALNKMGDTAGVTRACEILLPKFAAMMHNDKVVEVLIQLLHSVGQLFHDNKTLAMPNQECAELICNCISDVFLNKMTCQINDHSDDEEDDEDEYAAMIVENASNLVASFGLALNPETFSLYFGRLFHFLAQNLAQATKDDQPEHRAYIYGTLANSFQRLGSCSATYFDAVCPMILDGANDTDDESRRNLFYALGELVLNSGEKSFDSFPVILQVLSDAIARETSPAALDNICGALARLMITNLEAVPLSAVLPVFLSHLPLREDVEDYDMVVKAFLLLYTQAGLSIVDHIEQMVYIILTALQQEQIADKGVKMHALEFAKLVREQHPDKFNNVLNSNPELSQFVQTV